MGSDQVKPMCRLYCTSQISSYPVFNISVSDGINLGAASCVTRIPKILFMSIQLNLNYPDSLGLGKIVWIIENININEEKN